MRRPRFEPADPGPLPTEPGEVVRPQFAAPHPLSLLRGEFVWEGKYDAQGRRREPVLPPEPPRPELSEAWAPADMELDSPHAAPNLLLAGDNRLALAALLATHRGQVQLIYIDPPFDTGTDHTMRVPVGAGGGHRQRAADVDDAAAGDNRHLELVAYRDAWGAGAGSYLQMMYERLRLMRELLSPSGVLALHCDWRSSAALRLVLDEVFGPERFLNEIVWHYYNKYSAGVRCLPRAHDTILLYARGPRPALNELRLPRENPTRQLVRQSVNGVLRNARDAQGHLRYRMVHDRKGDDVWRIPQLQPASREWSGYSTQKHHDLLARIVALASREGDLVADFFCGSGTTLAVAERMGRRWIGCDQGTMALHTTRKRLLNARAAAPAEVAAAPAAPPPFVTASLAPEARREWYAREFGGDAAACRSHLLLALGAQPLAKGRGPKPAALHGWLDGAACAVPVLDPTAPTSTCTAEHALAAGRAAQALGAQRLVLLAWQYDAGFWSGVQPWAQPAGMEIVPLLVPEALVTPAGSAPPVFRALPRLEARAQVARGRAKTAPGSHRVTLQLVAFRPGPSRPAWSDAWDALPEAGKDPLQWLDGWSVDPAWRPDAPFRHAWWDFRTPHARDLATRSAALPGGAGQPCVLATDAWGQATLHAVDSPTRTGRVAAAAEPLPPPRGLR
ncbi:MAG TPA: site-specific DNA-methyltransferase [bacterium]|nr:site-specific DNA-methyltransferase [bacterium]